MNDPEDLIDRLISHQIPFVIVGGYAAFAHGCTLLTQDLDLCIPFTTDTLLRLQQALQDLHPIHRLTHQRVPLNLSPSSCEGLRNLYLDTDWGMLDCLGEIAGIGSYEQALQASLPIPFPSGPCRMLSREALITAKKAMGRPRDLETVSQLEHLIRIDTNNG